MRAAAVIPAGGRGSRMGGETPKQYINIDGMPILAHTLKKFFMAGIDEIVLAVPAGDMDFVRNEIIGRFLTQGRVQIVPGGRERQDSVRAGLDAIPEDAEIVLVHDAVRPFIAPGLIGKVIEEARACSAAALGVPVRDTVKSVSENRLVTGTVDRSNLWLTQTPQAFKKEILLEAYRLAYKDGFYATDDASLVERAGVAVKMVMGSYDNIKITTADDLKFAEFMLNKEKAP